MWKTIERTAHRLGFTKNEAVVILFLATVVLTGQAIGMWSDNRTQQPDYTEQYRQHDQVFAARSGSLPAKNRETLSDGQHVPAGKRSAEDQRKTQTGAPTAGTEKTDNSVHIATVLNINSATAGELETLPGIGPVTARRIIDYREQQGKFSAAEDIMKVKSIGPKKFEKLRQFICTE